MGGRGRRFSAWKKKKGLSKATPSVDYITALTNIFLVAAPCLYSIMLIAEYRICYHGTSENGPLVAGGTRTHAIAAAADNNNSNQSPQNRLFGLIRKHSMGTMAYSNSKGKNKEILHKDIKCQFCAKPCLDEMMQKTLSAMPVSDIFFAISLYTDGHLKDHPDIIHMNSLIFIEEGIAFIIFQVSDLWLQKRLCLFPWLLALKRCFRKIN